jgi:hypothetical protein
MRVRQAHVQMEYALIQVTLSRAFAILDTKVLYVIKLLIIARRVPASRVLVITDLILSIVLVIPDMKGYYATKLLMVALPLILAMGTKILIRVSTEYVLIRDI